MGAYQGTENLTEVSARQWDYVTQENLTAREAVAFLLNGMQFRRFRDILRQVCGSDDREQQIIQGLCSLNRTSQPDSIRRKVRSWMSGKALPTEREDVFQITQAAQCHFLTQTAITQQIKALEDSLGFPLINWKKSPIELTPAGAVFYQETKAILARMDEAVAKAQEEDEGCPEGDIAPGTSWSDLPDDFECLSLVKLVEAYLVLLYSASVPLLRRKQ